jgi:hypothetical protein
MAKKRKRDIPAPHEAASRPRRKTRTAAILVCLGAVAALLGGLAFDKLPSPIGDNAEFAILARALASGHGLRYINHPDLLPATKYPPGFPLLLAMWIPIFGSSMLVMKMVVFGCYVLMVPATYLLARRFLSEGLSAICALMIASSGGLTLGYIGVLPYSHEVLSDVPYAFFSLAALLAVMVGARNSKVLLVGLGLVVWAYVVRSAGLSLVAAVALYLVLKSRRREALLLVGAVVIFSGLWALRNYMVAGEGSRYMQVLVAKNPYDPGLGTVGLGDVLRRMGINLSAYLRGYLPENVLPALAGYGGNATVRGILSVAIIGIMLLGAYSLRGKAQVLNIYAGFYFLGYLFWPEVWRSGRFMVPLAPIAAVFFVAGIRKVCTYLTLKRTATLVVCGAFAATNLYSFSGYATRPRGYPQAWLNYLNAASWASKNTDARAVFLCRSAYLFFIFSGRRTIQYPFTHDAQEMRDYLFGKHPDYIVLDNDLGFPQTQTYLVPVLRTMEDMLEQVYATGEPVNMIVRFTPPTKGDGR